MTGSPHDRALLARVRPPDHAAPAPLARYDLVVVGGGAAGLVSAMGAAGLGARVALIERERLGGDCLNTGCVPSKALLRAARAAHEARSAGRFGVSARPEVDFPAVMERVRAARAALAAHDSAERLSRAGVHVFFGEGTFSGPDAVRVGPHTLRFRRAFLAMGASPTLPEALRGLYTTETLWSMDTLPARLLVAGGGPVGVELAQAFARLGSAVTLVEGADRILPREHPEAARRIRARLEREGVAVITGRGVAAFSPGLARLSDGAELPVDAGVAALGRRPRLEGLAEAGVALAQGRPVLTPGLRTTNPRVWAVGDIGGLSETTHGADATARLALRNAFFPGSTPFDATTLPRCIWTDPELAQLGALESSDDSCIRIELNSVDRFEIDDDTDGFIEIHIDTQSRVTSATLLSHHAADSVALLSHLMSQKLPLHALTRAHFPYPSAAEPLRRAADEANRRRLSPALSRLLGWFMRGGP